MKQKDQKDQTKGTKGSYRDILTIRGRDWPKKGDRMMQGPDETRKANKPPKTRVQRLAERIAKANSGAAAQPVKLAAVLQGPAAETWRALVEARGEMPLDDSALLGLLLEAGASTVRQALRAASNG